MRRSRSAKMTCSLVPLARFESAQIDFSSRTLWDQAFDNGVYQLKRRYFQCGSMGVPQFRCFCLRLVFCRSCFYSHQRHRSPVGHILLFQKRWGAEKNSWPNSDKLVLLVFIVVYHFLLILFCSLAYFLPRHHGVSCYSRNVFLTHIWCSSD